MTPAELANLERLTTSTNRVQKLTAKIALLQAELIAEQLNVTTYKRTCEGSPSMQARGQTQWLDPTVQACMPDDVASFEHNCHVQRGIGANPSIMLRGDSPTLAKLAHTLESYGIRRYTKSQTCIESIEPYGTQSIAISSTHVYIW